MKKITYFLVVCLSAGLMTGCAVTPPGPSVASLGMGEEVKAINKSRGQLGAQSTAAQEEQQERQIRMTKREMELEDAKRRREQENTNGVIQNLKDAAGVASGIGYFIQSVVGR